MLGLIYGIVGFALHGRSSRCSALRKKFPIWRIGRAQTWMRGHLWLGALSLPLILLHAGFLFGHGLTLGPDVALRLRRTSAASFGAWLQHTMPRRLLREVPMETIYDQIDHVRAQLLDEADTVVADACGKLEVEIVGAGGRDLGRRATRWRRVMRAGSGGAGSTTRAAARVLHQGDAPVRRVRRRARIRWPTRSTAAAMFGKLRPLVQRALAAGDRRSREHLRRGAAAAAAGAACTACCTRWLIVHVPLSFALMVLAVVHIVMALQVLD